MFFCLNYLWRKAPLTKNIIEFHALRAVPVSQLSFFASVKCVWTSRQQVSHGQEAQQAGILGHAGRMTPRAKATSQLSAWSPGTPAQTQEALSPCLTTLDPFESIPLLIFYIVPKTYNLQPPHLGKAAWCGRWSAGREQTHGGGP